MSISPLPTSKQGTPLSSPELGAQGMKAAALRKNGLVCKPGHPLHYYQQKD